MDPRVFRKSDAPSCLVVDKTWDEIINKPDFFDELVDRLVQMENGAKAEGLILKTTTFGEFKRKIMAILLTPLQDNVNRPEEIVARTPGSVLADAFWDEIITKVTWQDFKEALQRAYMMREQIQSRTPLTAEDTLQNTKDNFNDTIVKPMLGIDDDE